VQLYSGMSETPTPLRVTIRSATPCAPYVLNGDFEVVDGEGNPLDLPPRANPQRLSLCSCGQSSKWPVCDGTHKGLPGHQVTAPTP
jgi:hypothetical protein